MKLSWEAEIGQYVCLGELLLHGGKLFSEKNNHFCRLGSKLFQAEVSASGVGWFRVE